MEYLKLERCSKRFDKQPVLKEISYSFFTGGYCISGENGSGKSILLKMMMGLILPDTGQVTVIKEKSSQ
ncbi:MULTISPECIES: ATP-binding cassette domain-containing protein [Terrabacteria group]|uniref:ATP-binding cassette domain-containing protein n=1 Tax=Bacillati TaxID=1783272 RepID=UPI001939985F|nr:MULTISPECIES: ATP-binding cassette domain-containing protein [Terrabacteria group]MBW9211948.1 ATP-binding cassette domain-containing protein [Trueperella sp. zg.1013]QRG87252.1 ATP-binding cassette domain-containing protein [Bulleidia sp. zg-1006]